MKPIITSLILVFLYTVSFSQTYATEALRLKAEKELKIKDKNQAKEVISKEEEIKNQPLDLATLKNTFKLIRYDVFDYQSKHTESELNAFKQEMKEEFERTDIRVSSKLDKIYFINVKDLTKYSIKGIAEKEGKLVYLNCEKCKNSFFSVKSSSKDVLILEMLSQDEGTYYTIQLTFKI